MILDIGCADTGHLGNNQDMTDLLFDLGPHLIDRMKLTFQGCLADPLKVCFQNRTAQRPTMRSEIRMR